MRTARPSGLLLASPSRRFPPESPPAKRRIVMKAFILAAGSGTRLRPLTDSVPKCLLPIRGVPLLQIWLENCCATGISEVLVNVHAHPEKFREFVRKQASPVRINIVEEQQLLGSAGTLAENRSFVEQEKDFFVLY